MKKIFLLFTVVCMIFACDPSEDIKNGGHITAEELKAMSSVTLDKDEAGNFGNVVTCTTSAPVNAAWTAGGKILVGNYAWKKLKLGEQVVTLTGLCADGTVVTVDFPINVQVITDPLQRYYIYGIPEEGNPNHHMIEKGVQGAPFKPGAWDAAAMRFSENEGKFVDNDGVERSLPYLTKEIYFGYKTLVFDIQDATDDCYGRVMNGWWSARYDNDKDVHFTNGQWELPITEKMAKDCAATADGGEGRDLDLMVTSGSCQINSIYYEE